MIEPQIEHVVASDGYRLMGRRWRPDKSPPRAFVVALHGIQSHSGWYEFSSRRLCESGFDVSFVDRRGSGLNGAHRGDAAHAERLLNDVRQVLLHVRCERDRLAPHAPLVLLAVSWGGKLAAVTASRRPELVDALALLYPGLCARVQPNAWQRFRLWLARKLELHHVRVQVPLDDPALFTGQPQWQEFIRQDALALRDVTSRFLLAHQDLSRWSLEAAPNIRCPVLLMLAGRDRMIDNDATKRWQRNVGSRDVTLHEYADAQHTLEFEPRPEVFVADLLAWLETLTNFGASHRA